MPPNIKYSPLKVIFLKRIKTILFALSLAETSLLGYASDRQIESESFKKTIEASSLNELESLRGDTEAELDNLANFNLRGGIGPICFRSMPQSNENALQWAQINLDREYPLHEIALVPAIWRDNENGHRDDGFPKQFRILAGTDEDREGEVIASVNADETILPRIAPLLISCGGINASWIKIEAGKLSPRFHDQNYILQFSEVMVFSGAENIALHQEVLTSSEQRSGTGAYKREHLVDGFLPYRMDAALGSKSNPYLSGLGIDANVTLTIDLETPHSISKIRIHTIEQGDTIPHALPPNFAVPPHLQFLGANKPDFSDANVLWDYQPKGPFEIAPIITKRTSADHAYRYIRLQTITPFIYNGFDNNGQPLKGHRLGFAELELYSQNVNVALGKRFVPNYDASEHDPDRPLSRLTDGHNIFGEILPFKEWIIQLARRHDLEYQLPLIERAIQSQYDEQKAKLRLWVGIAATLGALIIIIFLADRILRQRAIFRTRERIAADLHDELGANLHAIALLGDLALANNNSPEKSNQNIERIRALVRRTGKAVKYCTNILDTPGLYQNLQVEMKRISHRLMADLEHTLDFQGEEHFPRIRPRKRIDLFLFYKESLINILRHSKATIVHSKLSLSESQLELTVSDNGQGLSQESPEPPSLKRRARLIGGKLSVNSTSESGATIVLTMKL